MQEMNPHTLSGAYALYTPHFKQLMLDALVAKVDAGVREAEEKKVKEDRVKPNEKEFKQDALLDASARPRLSPSCTHLPLQWHALSPLRRAHW